MKLDELFFEAIRLGFTPIVKQLIKSGVNARADNDLSIQIAAGYGQLEAVKYLISLGANVRVGNDHALRWARYNEHYEVADYIENLILQELQNEALHNN